MPPPSMSIEDINDAFARACRLGADLGIETGNWRLVAGNLGTAQQRRTAWSVLDERGRRVFTLGFTMRSALDNLTVIATAWEHAVRATKV